MKVTRTSPRTGKETTLELDVTREQLIEFAKPASERRKIQDIFPNLNDDEREFIKTGLTPEDWEEIFIDFED